MSRLGSSQKTVRGFSPNSQSCVSSSAIHGDTNAQAFLLYFSPFPSFSSNSGLGCPLNLELAVQVPCLLQCETCPTLEIYSFSSKDIISSKVSFSWRFSFTCCSSYASLISASSRCVHSILCRFMNFSSCSFSESIHSDKAVSLAPRPQNLYCTSACRKDTLLWQVPVCCP